MRVHRGLLLGALLSLAMGMSAQAGLISGSLPLTGINVTQNGADLSVSTNIGALFDLTTGAGSGNLLPIPLLTAFTDTGIDLTLSGNRLRVFDVECDLWHVHCKQWLNRAAVC